MPNFKEWLRHPETIKFRKTLDEMMMYDYEQGTLDMDSAEHTLSMTAKKAGKMDLYTEIFKLFTIEEG